MTDVIIIGNGPAGVSSALYTVRGGLKTVIVGKDGGSLEKADKIENYFGLENPISGTELLNNGISQVKKLGVEVIKDEVLSIGYNGNFVVQTKDNKYESKSIILATGSSRATPNIKGLKEFEGRGVSYCAMCDAFFYKGKDVAVLGAGDYAINEAKEILPIAKSVALLTNGDKPIGEVSDGIDIENGRISEFGGQDSINYVAFEDGRKLEISGVFIAIGVAGSSSFAKKLGAITKGTTIAIDENGATNIPGLFAAGDCTGGMLQIAKAVYDGAKAGASVIKYIRTK